MGGYFSSSKKASGSTPKATVEDGSADKRGSKYRVVYLERDVRISEHPRDLGALFVLRRTG